MEQVEMEEKEEEEQDEAEDEDEENWKEQEKAEKKMGKSEGRAVEEEKAKLFCGAIHFFPLADTSILFLDGLSPHHAAWTTATM